MITLCWAWLVWVHRRDGADDGCHGTANTWPSISGAGIIIPLQLGFTILMYIAKISPKY